MGLARSHKGSLRNEVKLTKTNGLFKGALTPAGWKKRLKNLNGGLFAHTIKFSFNLWGNPSAFFSSFFSHFVLKEAVKEAGWFA